MCELRYLRKSPPRQNDIRGVGNRDDPGLFSKLFRHDYLTNTPRDLVRDRVPSPVKVERSRHRGLS